MRIALIHGFIGFAWQYHQGAHKGPGYQYWHSGFAWACTRKAWDAMGGLIDFAILGAGDHHMATAWIGDVRWSIPKTLSNGYLSMLTAYQDRCQRAFGNRIGYVRGSIIHYWHGKKAQRRYKERWSVLVDGRFDPITDISRDWQGLFKLTDAKPRMAEEISRYFRQRNEGMSITWQQSRI